MSSTSLEQIKNMLNRKSAGQKESGGNIKWYKFPKGTEEVKFRLLPAWQGADFPIKVMKRHYGIPGLGDKKSAMCPTTFDLECPVCEVLSKYEGKTEKTDDYAARLTGNANILVKKDPTQSGINALEAKVAGLSKGQVDWFVDLFTSDEDAKHALTDPYEGRDVVAKREKFNGKFEMRTAFSPSPIGDENQVDSVLAGITNLDEVYKAPTDDDINLLMKSAKELDEIIENLIMSTATPNGGVDDHDEIDAPPKMEKTKPAPAAVQKQQAAKTTGANLGKPQGAKPQTQVSAPKTTAATTKPAAAASPKSNAKPAGSPECFGVAGEHNAESDKCVVCEWEYQCESSSKG
jgi:hypothetical protein